MKVAHVPDGGRTGASGDDRRRVNALYGGLVSCAAFTTHKGVAEGLAAACPVERSSPSAAPVYDVIQSFMLVEGSLRLHGWAAQRRVVFACCLQGELPGPEHGEFCDRAKHEFAVCVTNLGPDYNAWQIQQFYRERVGEENVFDELKNQ